MIRGFIEGMLGEVGRSLIYFYEQNALVLGLIIVAYGALMYFSWMNLIRIYRFLVLAAAATLKENSDKTGSLPAKAAPAKRAVAASSALLPWQEAVDSARFPLVSQRAGLLPARKSISAAKRIIDERELWEHARAVAAGANIQRISPEYRLAPRKQAGTHGTD